MSSLLTQEEGKEYFDLLSEYKDVFAWSYKENVQIRPKTRSAPLVYQKRCFTLEAALAMLLPRVSTRN